MSRQARAVAVLVAATPVLSVLAPSGAPATAATCAAGGGVSVVVDYNSLGGGVSTGCVAGGGGDTASALFTAAGHELTRAQRQPGFVCRVDAVPADDPCVDASPASAYWGLWWSDGETGEWTYSSLGVDSLEVPDGGSVAFSWDDVEGSAPPSATAPQAAPSASPSSGTGGAEGSGGGTSGSSGGAGTPAPTASGSPTAAGSDGADGAAGAGGSDRDRAGDDGRRTLREVRREKREQREDRERDDATATASASPTDAAEATSDPTPVSAEDDGADGLPVWVAPLAVLLLATAAGVTVLLRRRSTP